MNEKEIGELRRRFRPEKSNITHVRGCYVNEKREIVSQFDQSLAMMTQTETEEILAILRRTLSGTLGKNLIDDTRSSASRTNGPNTPLRPTGVTNVMSAPARPRMLATL